MTGRLAPTPSGALHLGNACAFAAAWLSARSQGGRLLLRMEDVDRERARDDLADGIRRDLDWLRLHWDEEVPAQAARNYAPWLERLPTYRCVCTRKQLGGGVYAGTCREAGHGEGAVRFPLPPGELVFVDGRFGPQRVDPREFGDPVLRRRDGLHTYNLAVVADDILDGVSEVVRGADLLGFTGVQIRLWEAFAATPPRFVHAPLVLGPDGKKLSKSHGAMGIEALRAAGWGPKDVWRTVLPWLGLAGHDDLAGAARVFDPATGPLGPLRLQWTEPGCPSPAQGVSWHPDGRGTA